MTTIIIIAVLLLGSIVALVWYLKARRPVHLSIIETLEFVVTQLSLERAEWRKVPLPHVRGVYFHYSVSMEGFVKKGYGFRISFLLPGYFSDRIFLQSEDRKASLKPIATLGLVHTEDANFDRHFLLCSDNTKLVQALFNPHLCGKILGLGTSNVRLDIHGKEAVLELKTKELLPHYVARWVEILAELINSLETALKVSDTHL